MDDRTTRKSFLLNSGGVLLSTFLHSGDTAITEERYQPTDSESFFPGFKKISVKTSGAIINGVIGGNGPPLLLIHGYPQSHLEWHKVASLFAKNYTVVATDLRGYGDSSKPKDVVDHFSYSKRAMAQDQVEVMEHFGFKSFKIVGHDRGGRVAHRMALDNPDKIQKLVLLDIVPTYKLYTTTNKAFASTYWHWFFLIQPAPLPETLLLNNAEFFLRNWSYAGMIPKFIPENIFNEYLKYFKNPATQHAMCEDYRAGASIDLEHDEEDLNKKITCPLLVLWGENGAMHNLFSVLEIWKERATNVVGKHLPCGHWMPEQLPEDVFNEVNKFFKD
jgi:haloacetate dehalogenase